MSKMSSMAPPVERVGQALTTLWRATPDMKLTVYCEPVAMTALTTQKTPPNNHSDGAHYCSADGQGEEPDPQNNDDHQKYCFDLETPLSLNAYMYVFNVPRHVHVCNLAGPVGEAACQRKSSGARLERLSDVPEGTERHYCEGCDHVLERATASEQGDSC